ncbi:hypothetical protein MN0502_32140 [Arthrobacter sp. MN05-02]|nr:hypothetical protein MN0502_32140 [Arthrobacter sp. MN05-02]
MPAPGSTTSPPACLPGHRGVARTEMSGSAAVALNGKLVAALDREGRLMLEAPADRAAHLEDEGVALPARIGRGRLGAPAGWCSCWKPSMAPCRLAPATPP